MSITNSRQARPKQNKARKGPPGPRVTTTHIPKSLPISERFVTTLVYADQLSFNPGTPYYNHQFRGNSLYDFDLTGTGHQPLYFDKFCSATGIYSKYRVLKTTIDIEFGNSQTTDSLCSIIIPSAAQVSPQTYSQAAEYPRASVSNPSAAVQNRTMAKVRCTATTSEILGLTQMESADNDLAASYNASPAKLWFFNVCFVHGYAGTNCAGNFRFKTKFLVEFFDRINESQSYLDRHLERSHDIVRDPPAPSYTNVCIVPPVPPLVNPIVTTINYH